ncbi:hypothetical protein KM043_010349 [Ampulex compressa]|nr:hypothetical protein KM043_010349 [Ampulex compressa]
MSRVEEIAWQWQEENEGVNLKRADIVDRRQGKLAALEGLAPGVEARRGGNFAKCRVPAVRVRPGVVAKLLPGGGGQEEIMAGPIALRGTLRISKRSEPLVRMVSRTILAESNRED